MFAKLFRRKTSPPLPTKSWPFSSPQNEAVFTVEQILHGASPILLVQHDAEGGGWQFLTGGEFSQAHAKIVGLGEIAKLDPTILPLADLPEGWRATRTRTTDQWLRAQVSDLRITVPEWSA